MPSQEAVDAAVRAYAALLGGEGYGGDANLFASTVVDAGLELEGGFEELAAGLLQVIAVLTELVASCNEITRAQVVRAVGLALAPRD